MTPLQDFMAAAGFSVKHGDRQTEVYMLVSDNAKGGLKVRTSSTEVVATLLPTRAQHIWLVSGKKSSSSSSTTTTTRVRKWPPPSESFASDDVVTPEKDRGSSFDFHEQESGSPRSLAGTSTITVPVTNHRPPQESADQEQKEQNDEISSVVFKENNDALLEEKLRRPLVKKLIQVSSYPAIAVKGHPCGHCSPTKSPAAA
jgi:hypothetical protein